MSKVQSRITREKQIVERMIRLYCRKKEKNNTLCPSCQALLEYACARLEHCLFGEEKGSCKNCPVHCYKPLFRQQMREVMRYSGPRMLRYAPWETLKHLCHSHRISKFVSAYRNKSFKV